MGDKTEVGGTIFLFLLYCITLELVLCELSPQNINELCKDFNEIGLIPYAGQPNKFILCVGNGTTTSDTCNNGVCLNSNDNKTANHISNDASYVTAQRFCQTAPILAKVSFFDCQKYYICAGKGKDPITVHCHAHQHYSKYEQKCTSPLEAYCLPPQYWCDNQPDGLQFPAAQCFQYYECAKGVTALKTCPYDQHFDKVRNQCVPGICKDSSDRQPNCADYKEGDFLFHPNCHKYYVCIKNKAYEGQCSPGFYFDSETKHCLRDVNNKCQST